MLARESAQLWDESRKIVLLEQADAGDACRTGVKTRAGIGERRRTIRKAARTCASI